MIEWGRFLRFFQRNRKILFAFFLLVAFDIFAATLGHSFLSELFQVFSGKSKVGVLSDLLFLEGALIFALGALASSAKPWVSRTSKHTHDGSNMKETSGNDTRVEKHPWKMDIWILMIIMGATLIGLSIATGFLLV